MDRNSLLYLLRDVLADCGPDCKVRRHAEAHEMLRGEEVCATFGCEYRAWNNGICGPHQNTHPSGIKGAYR